jgi:membrane-associated phospholipid phosphatase
MSKLYAKFFVFFSFFVFVSGNLHAQTLESDAIATDDPQKKSDSANQLKLDENKVQLYRVNYWVSGAVCLVASAADIYAIPNIIKGKKDITNKEFEALNPGVFNDFDRWALSLDVTKRNDFYKASDYALPVIIAVPALLAFDKNIKKDWFKILVMYYEMHCITFSIYNFSFLGPAFQNKYRPYVYYNELPIEARNGGNNRNSMYSGHTATAIASTFFMVKVYSDYHPEIGNKKYLLYGVAAIPALVEGYLRVKALAHFPSDGMIGIGVGALAGVFIPTLHRFKNKNVNMSLSPSPYTGQGLGLNVNWRLEGNSHASVPALGVYR